MQDQNNNVAGNNIAGEPSKAEQFLEMLRGAEAAIFIQTDEAGALLIRGVAANSAYRPGQDAAHAFMAAVQGEHDHLLDVVNGRQNDATRFRALRTFALMKGTDSARFEAVNEMLQKFEHDNHLDDEKARTEADHNAIADFLALAILETEPVLLAPTTVRDEPAAIYTGPGLVLPH